MRIESMIEFSRRRIIASLLWTFTASILSSQFSFIKADLPIHAALNDVKGTWTIHLSAPTDLPAFCGSHSPNKNNQNLAPELRDYKNWIQKNAGGIKHTMTIELTDDRSAPLPSNLLQAVSVREFDQKSNVPSHRKDWSSLAVVQQGYRSEGALSFDDSTAKDNNTQSVGSWTMIYDEGMEIRYGDRLTLTGFLSYSLSPSDQCKGRQPSDTDQEDSDGKTECYVTNPGKTSLGWYTDYSENRPLFGCWYGEKISSPNGATTNSPFLYVGVNPNYVAPRTTFTDLGSRLWTSSEEKLPEGVPDHLVRQNGWWKSTSLNTTYSNFKTQSFLNIQSTLGSQSYACDQSSNSRNIEERFDSYPKNYSSVPNPFALSANDHHSWSTPVAQGDCGSCYAIASSYVLQERSQIQLRKLKEHSKDHASSDFVFPELSLQSVISCSFHNQGCSGGYPYLVGKWAQEFGLKTSECQPYVKSDKERCKMNLGARDKNEDDNDACGPKNTIYASGYGYVGGCYECNSELAMVEEIYYHGPIVAALDAPPSLFRYSGGVFDDDSYHHSRLCDDPNKGLNGWEFTNHAVVIVGWGEEEKTNTNPIKYWIVRNSWGPHWGRGGYFKFLRGVNLGGIEGQAVFLDPDFSRGLLFEASKKILYENPADLISGSASQSLGVAATSNRLTPISAHEFNQKPESN